MTQPAQPAAPRVPRLTRGPVRTPDRVLVYGMEGVGKSSFAGGRRLPDGTAVPGAPRPIFLDLDNGSGALDVARAGDPNDPDNPVPSTWDEVIAFVRALQLPEYRGDRMTLVIDTADKLERQVIWPEVVRRYKPEKKDQAPPEKIGDIGFFKGYVQSLDIWAEFLRELDWLQARTKMGVILVAHATKVKVENLRGSDFSTYEPDLYSGRNSSAAELLREWADCVFFAGFDDDARREAGDSKKAAGGVPKLGKGFTTGDRLIWTVHQGWAMAKNRYCLQETMPLEYSAYADGVAAYFSGAWRDRPDDPESLRRQVESAADEVRAWPETPADWYGSQFGPHLVRAGLEPAALRKLLEQLQAKVARRAEALRPSGG